jgi:hypothetical protein
MSNDRIVESNFVTHRRRIIRIQGDSLVTALDHNRAQNPNFTPFRGQRLDTGAIDEKHERLGAAVHHRDFGTVEFDHDIIDATAPKRRHQMFDRRHSRAIVGDQGGPQPGLGDKVITRGNAQSGQICSHERNPAIGGRR